MKQIEWMNVVSFNTHKEKNERAKWGTQASKVQGRGIRGKFSTFMWKEHSRREMWRIWMKEDNTFVSSEHEAKFANQGEKKRTTSSLLCEALLFENNANDWINKDGAKADFKVDKNSFRR